MLGVRRGPGFLGWHSGEPARREGRESSHLYVSGAANQGTSIGDWIPPLSRWVSQVFKKMLENQKCPQRIQAG